MSVPAPAVRLALIRAVTVGGLVLGLLLGMALHLPAAVAGSDEPGSTGWFHDPVSAAGHQAEIAVPQRPRAYDGPRRWTRAHYRTSGGAVAVPAAWAVGHVLVAGQALTLDGPSLFDYRSTRPSPATRRLLRDLAPALADATTVRCEGYADPVGAPGRERPISRARARAVCSLLAARHPDLVTRAVGFGGSRPVRVGATTNPPNRRVVVQVTRTDTAPVPGPHAPGAPEITSVSASAGVVHLELDGPASDGGSVVTGFDYSIDGGDDWDPLAHSGTGPYEAEVTVLAGGDYALVVRARNVAGAGPASQAWVVTVPPWSLGAPTLESAYRWTDGDEGTEMTNGSFSFTDGEATGTLITGYQWSVDDGASWHGFTEQLSHNGTLVWGNTANGTFGSDWDVWPLVRVRATDGVHFSPASNAVEMVPLGAHSG